MLEGTFLGRGVDSLLTGFEMTAASSSMCLISSFISDTRGVQVSSPETFDGLTTGSFAEMGWRVQVQP
jgi:hypothetical protein